MRVRRCVWLLAVLLSAGCGRSAVLVPVSGVVTLDEKPLEGASVAFMPDAGGKPMSADYVGSQGKTDANGRYSLTTMEAEPRAGALLGKHRVTITLMPAEEAQPDAGPASRRVPQKLPAKYNIDTQLECIVPRHGRTDANFDLQSK
jgi:hypothetical protein